MGKKREKEDGSKGGYNNQQLDTEPKIPEYEKLRNCRVEENVARMKAIGLVDKARSLMDLIQKKTHQPSKRKNKNVMDEGDLDFEIEQEMNVSSEDDLSKEINERRPLSKRCKVKRLNTRAMALAKAFKKRQEKVQCSSLTTMNVNDLILSNEANNENDVSEKSKRGPTMCHKVHGRREEDRKEIILNEHFQPVGPDDDTLNEFSSFLGTVARKANILPLTVKNWPTLRKKKAEELWVYVTNHYIVPIEGKKWVLRTIGACWRGYKCSLKKKHHLQYSNDEVRLENRPRRIPLFMFKALLKIWNDDEDHKVISERNRRNRLVGKEKNIMHTTGPKSFARIKENWKKKNNTAKDPSLGECFIMTHEEKTTKRKPGDPRDKIINELKQFDSVINDDESVLSVVFGSNDEKKHRRLRLYGRGVSHTQLKQKSLMEEAKRKQANEIEVIKAEYEEKRQQDKAELSNGLHSFIDQFQQQCPNMSIDFSKFGSLLDNHQTQNSQKMLQPCSTSTSNNRVMYSTDDEMDDVNVEDLT